MKFNQVILGEKFQVIICLFLLLTAFQLIFIYLYP